MSYELESMVIRHDEQLKELSRELTATRAEIAELNEEYGTWWAQKSIALDELKEVTEQRDRLAELLSEYMTKVPLGNQPHMLALKADEALQSLTTKEQ